MKIFNYLNLVGKEITTKEMELVRGGVLVIVVVLVVLMVVALTKKLWLINLWQILEVLIRI